MDRNRWTNALLAGSAYKQLPSWRPSKIARKVYGLPAAGFLPVCYEEQPTGLPGCCLQNSLQSARRITVLLVPVAATTKLRAVAFRTALRSSLSRISCW